MNHRKMLTLLLCAGVLGALGIGWNKRSPTQGAAPPTAATMQEQSVVFVYPESAPIIDGQVPGPSVPGVHAGPEDEGCPYADSSPHGELPSQVSAEAMHTTPEPQVPSPQAGEIAPTSPETTVQALHARRDARGKVVQVRARVVRIVEGVMGTNFVHLRDGTGADANGDADLTATMTVPPQLGETVVVEGRLLADHEVGTGYVYRVLLEDARRTQ